MPRWESHESHPSWPLVIGRRFGVGGAGDRGARDGAAAVRIVVIVEPASGVGRVIGAPQRRQMADIKGAGPRLAIGEADILNERLSGGKIGGVMLAGHTVRRIPSLYSSTFSPACDRCRTTLFHTLGSLVSNAPRR